MVAHSAGTGLVGAVGGAGRFNADIFVAILPENDPAWATTPGFSEAQKFVEYPELGLPDAGDGGLISGERVLDATGALFLGPNLLVLGRTQRHLPDEGLAVLFSPNGQPSPRGLAASTLVEPRVTHFQAGSVIGSGGAWAAGPTPSGRVGVVKLTQQNAVDTTFGVGGFVELGEVGQAITVHGIGSDALGRVIVMSASISSAADASSSASPSIHRLSPSGAADLTFGVGGLVQVPFFLPTSKSRLSMLVERGGGVLVGGVFPPPPGKLFSIQGAIARFDASGKLDTAFGGPGADGYATAPLPPGKGPDDSRSPGGVFLAAPPLVGSCEVNFFGFFSQDPDVTGYLFQ